LPTQIINMRCLIWYDKKLWFRQYNIRYLFFIIASIFLWNWHHWTSLISIRRAHEHTRTHHYILFSVVTPLYFASVDNFPTRPCIFYAHREQKSPPTIAKLLTAHNIYLSPTSRPFDLSRVKFFRLRCCTRGCDSWDHKHRDYDSQRCKKKNKKKNKTKQITRNQ